MTAVRLGCLADDFTGATDLATALRRAGLRPALVFGVPGAGDDLADGCDAVVVALKSRTIPVAAAVRQARAARGWLQDRGARQLYFKYCSTFDSTAEGNIGPVTEALLDDLGAPLAVVCPATPQNGRTVYQGHLFVGDRPLAETSMREHPLTPMTDSDLRRLLGRQTAARVGLVPLQTVAQGPAAVRSAVGALAGRGVRFAVADAVGAGDLETLGAACADMPLVTGAAGLGWGLARAAAGTDHGGAARDVRPPATGPAAVLAGSCSTRTLEQVRHASARMRAFKIDALALAAGEDIAGAALRWVDAHIGDSPLLLYSTVAADELRAVQTQAGAERAARLIETLCGELARRLVDLGVSRLIVAGGETAGAVVSALGIRSVLVGTDVDPGVPWTWTPSRTLALMLKSGNFGRPDLFTRALEG